MVFASPDCEASIPKAVFPPFLLLDASSEVLLTNFFALESSLPVLPLFEPL